MQHVSQKKIQPFSRVSQICGLCFRAEAVYHLRYEDRLTNI